MDAILQPPVGHSVSISLVSAGTNVADLMRMMSAAAPARLGDRESCVGPSPQRQQPHAMAIQHAPPCPVDRRLDPQVSFKGIDREGAAWKSLSSAHIHSDLGCGLWSARFNQIVGTS